MAPILTRAPKTLLLLPSSPALVLRRRIMRLVPQVQYSLYVFSAAILISLSCFPPDHAPLVASTLSKVR